MRLCIALVLILAAGAVHAQRQERTLGAQVPEEPPQESSKQVEESDESYRQRMELREGFPGQQTRIETTYSKPTSTARIDQLPAPSQKHIKDQLREMIMVNGQWEPGQDLSDYPYDPSAAAQTDARLRNAERGAWAEELQKYQEREAAAYAQAMGDGKGQGENQNPGEAAAAQAGQPGGQPGDQSGQAGQGGQSGMSGSPGSGSSGESLAERNARALAAAAAYKRSGTAGQPAEGVPEGISENALSYLQSKGGAAGASPTGSQQPGGQQQAGQQQAGQPGALSGGQPGEAGSGQQSGEGSDGQNAQMAQQGSGNPSGQQAQEASEGQSSDALAGTMSVGDLQNMYAESGQSGNSGPNSGSSSSSSIASSSASTGAGSASEGEARATASSMAGKQEITYRDVQRETEVQPGTLTLEELRSLDGSRP